MVRQAVKLTRRTLKCLRWSAWGNGAADKHGDVINISKQGSLRLLWGFIINSCLSRTSHFFFFLVCMYSFISCFQNSSLKCSFESRRCDNLITSQQGRKFSFRQTGPRIWEHVIFHGMSIPTRFAWQLISLINCCRSSVCTINPLILSSKCANIDPGRHHRTTLPSTVGPQRQYYSAAACYFKLAL